MMEKEDPIPFGSDPEGQKRWLALIAWWQKNTKLNLGKYIHEFAPNALWPPHPGEPVYRLVPGEMSIRKAWEGQSQEVQDACGEAYHLSVGFCTNSTWEQSLLGSDELNYRWQLHEDLTRKAKDLLSFTGTANWKALVSNEVSAAAEIIADAPNPYIQSTGRGDKICSDVKSLNRRATVYDLSQLRTSKGEPLSGKALTVIYLLCVPHAGSSGDTRSCWWSNDKRWQWNKVSDWEELRPFLGSPAFKKLENSIRKDCSNSRKRQLL